MGAARGARACARGPMSGRRGDSAVLAQEGEQQLDIRFGAPELDQAPSQASAQPQMTTVQLARTRSAAERQRRAMADAVAAAESSSRPQAG